MLLSILTNSSDFSQCFQKLFPFAPDFLCEVSPCNPSFQFVNFSRTQGALGGNGGVVPNTKFGFTYTKNKMEQRELKKEKNKTRN